MFGLKSKYIEGIKEYDKNAHAWNQVRIDGNWYNLDATWDAKGYQLYHSWDYALQSDDAFSSSHVEYKVRNYSLPCKKGTGYQYWSIKEIWDKEEHDEH